MVLPTIYRMLAERQNFDVGICLESQSTNSSGLQTIRSSERASGCTHTPTRTHHSGGIVAAPQYIAGVDTCIRRIRRSWAVSPSYRSASTEDSIRLVLCGVVIRSGRLEALRGASRLCSVESLIKLRLLYKEFDTACAWTLHMLLGDLPVSEIRQQPEADCSLMSRRVGLRIGTKHAK
jgi:hypothetical protein